MRAGGTRLDFAAPGRYQGGQRSPIKEPTLPRFQPAPWLSNRHAQTIWPALFRRAPAPALTPRRLELADGDFLDVFWGPERRQGPVVLLLHGLGGCARSGYILGLIARLSARGYQCVAMQYRGAGPANRLDRFFYAGDHHDPATVAEHIAAHAPGRPLYAVGFSLGANMLLTWLAVAGANGPVARAVAVSPPFDLGACADAINRGFARVYQRDLLNNLKRMYAAKFRDRPGPVPAGTVARLRTLRAFDDCITAPSHGFRDAADYYARCSCGPRIARVATPSLVLHARDDPFVPAGDIPAPADLPGSVTLEVSPRGGHVGFVAGRGPMRLWPEYWAEARIADFLDAAPPTG